MPNYRVSPGGTFVRAPDGQEVFLYEGMPVPEYVVDPVLQSLIDGGHVFDDTSEPHPPTGGGGTSVAGTLVASDADGMTFTLVDSTAVSIPNASETWIEFDPDIPASDIAAYYPSDSSTIVLAADGLYELRYLVTGLNGIDALVAFQGPSGTDDKYHPAASTNNQMNGLIAFAAKADDSFGMTITQTSGSATDINVSMVLRQIATVTAAA